MIWCYDHGLSAKESCQNAFAYEVLHTWIFETFAHLMISGIRPNQVNDMIICQDNSRIRETTPITLTPTSDMAFFVRSLLEVPVVVAEEGISVRHRGWIDFAISQNASGGKYSNCLMHWYCSYRSGIRKKKHNNDTLNRRTEKEVSMTLRYYKLWLSKVHRGLAMQKTLALWRSGKGAEWQRRGLILVLDSWFLSLVWQIPVYKLG